MGKEEEALLEDSDPRLGSVYRAGCGAAMPGLLSARLLSSPLDGQPVRVPPPESGCPPANGGGDAEPAAGGGRFDAAGADAGAFPKDPSQCRAEKRRSLACPAAPSRSARSETE